MISYGKQSIDKSDIKAVVDTLKSHWLTQGPKCEVFEEDLKNYFGASYACAVSNGTAALHLAGLALNWKKGDIVLTTPMSFLATSNCIIYTGAKPDFVDIDLVTHTIDPNLAEEKIKHYRKKGKNIKALIGVDFAGQPCDWKALRALANNYEFKLINDNCHALGAKYFDDKQYALKYADIATQSYHPVKHITTGEGGSVLTNSLEIDEKVRRLRTHGMVKGENQLSINNEPWYYEMHDVGFNYRITDFQSALGSNQLKKLDFFLKRRREIARVYDDAFENIPNLIIPKVNDECVHAYHLYPLQINFDKTNLSKSQLFKKLKKFDINLQVHYIPIHLQPYYKKNYGFRIGEYPFAEKFYQREVSLPIYSGLSKKDQRKVIRSLKSLINV
mgnify:CR=1 FL=1|tara:strand:+ start:1040 stop:2203 length:1164 start_codon:yes stop_codon:yes gene_type:complete